MPIPVVCSCSAKLKVGDHLQGKHIKCPKCGAVLVVGDNGGAAAPAHAAAPAAPAAPSTAEALQGSELSEPERDRLEAALERGERLVWAGKPVARVAFIRGWVVAVGWFFAAGVCLVILVLLLGRGVLHDGGGVFFAAIPGACAAGFLALSLVWPFLARRRAARTVYAFSNRRALAWESSLLGRVRHVVYDPAELTGLQRLAVTGGADAVGNLIFAARAVVRKTSKGREYTGAVRFLGFFHVRRAAEVEQLMREELIDPFLEQVYDK
jgi:hypothetical protein